MEKKKIGSSVVQLQLGRTLIHSTYTVLGKKCYKSRKIPNQMIALVNYSDGTVNSRPGKIRAQKQF